MQKAVTTRYEFDTGQHLSEPVRIAHVSDLHERDCSDILAMVREQKPDVIMVTGDTFERYDNRPQYEFYHRPVKRLIVNFLHYANYLCVLLMPEQKKASEEYVRSFLSEAVKIAPVFWKTFCLICAPVPPITAWSAICPDVAPFPSNKIVYVCLL